MLEKKKEMVAGGLRKRRGDTIEIYIQEEGNKQLRINFYFFKKKIKRFFLVGGGGRGWFNIKLSVVCTQLHISQFEECPIIKMQYGERIKM